MRTCQRTELCHLSYNIEGEIVFLDDFYLNSFDRGGWVVDGNLFKYNDTDLSQRYKYYSYHRRRTSAQTNDEHNNHEVREMISELRSLPLHCEIVAEINLVKSTYFRYVKYSIRSQFIGSMCSLTSFNGYFDSPLYEARFIQGKTNLI